MRSLHKLTCLLIAPVLITSLYSQAHDIYHELGLQQRVFSQHGPFETQQKGYMAASLNSFYTYSEDENVWAAEAWLRLDPQDSDRNNLDIREVYWLHYGDVDEWQIGLARVFWGVTESAHLVDVINQTDRLEGIDGEDKLGQPMVHYTRYLEGGQFELFVLPYFRTQKVASQESRFALPFEIHDSALFGSNAEQHHIDFAARYSQTVDALDFSFNIFKGTDREARFVLSDNQLKPFYGQTAQLGLTAQYLWGSWAFKTEAKWQSREASTLYNLNKEVVRAAVTGFEYTHVGVFGSQYDLGYIVEYQFDNRSRDQVLGQNDVFTGTRLAFNDSSSSEFIAGALVDLDDQSYSLRVEGSMRLSEQIKLELSSYLFKSKSTNLLNGFVSEDMLELNVFWYFNHDS